MLTRDDDEEEVVLDVSDVLEQLSEGLVELEVGLSYIDAEAIMIWHLSHGIDAWLSDPPS
jgi:hypothetical protein